MVDWVILFISFKLFYLINFYISEISQKRKNKKKTFQSDKLHGAMVLVIAPGLNHFYLSIKRNMLLGGQSLRRIKRVFTHNGKQQKLQVGLFNRM